MDEPWVLWTCETHQWRTLGLTSLWRIDQRRVCPRYWRDSPRTDLRFDKPSVCSAHAKLSHTCHLWSGTYWRCGVVLLHTCHSWNGTHWRLSFVLLHTCHSWSGTYWRCGVMLLHLCHSWSDTYWRRGGMLLHVSLMEWHVLETWWREPGGLTKGKPWVLQALWRNNQKRVGP